MKTSKLVLLAALPAAIMAANVQAAPEVYGKLNVSVQKNDSEDNTGDTLDNWSLDSNASRIGVKGDVALDDGLKAVYKLEYEAYVDDGDDGSTDTDGDSNSSELKQRNIYLGVQGGFGTVIGGKFDTPTKEAQGKVDQFNDYKLADITNVIVGENRASNIVMYSAPKVGGVALNVAVMPGEEDGVGVNEGDNGPADAVSASAVYDTNNLYLALAADSGVAGFNTVRLAAQYKIDALALGAILQHAEVSGDSDEEQDGVILSAAYTMDKCTFKAQYGHSELDVADTEVDSISVGMDHSLGKDAKAYVYYTMLESDAGTEPEDNTFGVGFEQKF